jgi:hypothetical protein
MIYESRTIVLQNTYFDQQGKFKRYFFPLMGFDWAE